MAFIADTHVHVYPGYDVDRLLQTAAAQLAALAPGCPRVLCLTERSDCSFFRTTTVGVRVGAEALRCDTAHGPLWLVAGRQLATREKLEVSVLGRDAELPDGLSLTDALARVRALEGIAVVPWGLGKWLGGRGALIKAALTADDTVWAGDSSLRPRGWPEPVFSAAQGRVLAGSDPLPAAGEEVQAGRYATVIEASFDEADPAGSLRSALRSGAPLRLVGQRGSGWSVWQRQQAMKRSRR